MPIFDSAIFDGPPGSIIFDTGAAVPVPRGKVLSQAQIHGIEGNASVHDKQSSARAS